jgi:penicillin-binding protein 1C
MAKITKRNPTKTKSRKTVKAHSKARPPESKKFPAKPKAQPNRIIQLLKRLVVFSIITLLLFTAAIYWFILKDLPSPEGLTTRNYPLSTLIYDRNDQLLYEIFAEYNRIPIKLEALPDHVKQATIAIEDKNFYTHHGISYTGISRAFLKNTKYLYCSMFHDSCSMNFQGGSTITQQLVKNTLLTPERTVQRKLKELILTVAVEIIYSKDQILEMYLNQIPYGGTAYGIEAAAKTYFNKSATDLTPAESTILTGLPVSPTRLSPFGANPELYKDRQQTVLRRMVEDEYISQSQSEEIVQQQVTFNRPKNLEKAPHFVLWVKELLVQKYGQQLVEQGGLRVTTSLNLDLQTAAQATVSAEIANLDRYQVSNGAALITNPGTGEVLAMVGSADYFNADIDGNVNLPLRYRQPGSSIKPLNYNLAFHLQNLAPAAIIGDLPTCFRQLSLPDYCPKNYDGSFHGAVSARAALANSYNIPAVKTLAKNNLRSFIATASAMGITGWDNPDNYGLSLTLGGGEVRMIDMAVAYSSLANLGVKVPLHPILKVIDHTGQILEEFTCQPTDPETLTDPDYELDLHPSCQAERLFEPGAPYLTTHILSDANARAPTFGSSLNIRNHPDVAVKTGTTNDLRDNWTIGYTHNRLITVWVGNNDNTPMSRIASGLTGASPIWHDLMTQALTDQEPLELAPPEGIYGTQICGQSGLLPPPEGCPSLTFDLFQADLRPTTTEALRRPWPIDVTTNAPALPDTPPEQVEMRDQAIVFDALGLPICLDCAIPSSPTRVTYPLPDQVQEPM